MMRQIAGAFHQYEKARLVAKLKAARDRKRATGARALAGRRPLLTAGVQVHSRPTSSNADCPCEFQKQVGPPA